MDVTTFLGLSLLPILSPGPSSILAVRNSQRHGLPFALQRLCTVASAWPTACWARCLWPPDRASC